MNGKMMTLILWALYSVCNVYILFPYFLTCLKKDTLILLKVTNTCLFSQVILRQAEISQKLSKS